MNKLHEFNKVKLASIRKKRIMDNLLTQWLSQSTENASNWISEMKGGEHQQYAMQQLTSRWSLVDPVSTAKWLNSFPPSPGLDPVVGEFVNRISGRDPEGAAGWALSIMDPGARKKAIDKVMNTWSKVDPERQKHGSKRINPPLKIKRLLLTNGFNDGHDG